MRFAFSKSRLSAFDTAGVCSALLVLAMGCVAAYWGVQLGYPSRPMSAASAQALPDAPSALVEMVVQFDPAGQGQEAMASLDVSLLGTVSVGERGRAVLLSEGKQVTLGLGDELTPGVVLSQVGPKFVEFSMGGATQRVELAEPTPSDQPPDNGRGAKR